MNFEVLKSFYLGIVSLAYVPTCMCGCFCFFKSGRKKIFKCAVDRKKLDTVKVNKYI